MKPRIYYWKGRWHVGPPRGIPWLLYAVLAGTIPGFLAARFAERLNAANSTKRAAGR